jgi:hypothetical protein
VDRKGISNQRTGNKSSSPKESFKGDDMILLADTRFNSQTGCDCSRPNQECVFSKLPAGKINSQVRLMSTRGNNEGQDGPDVLYGREQRENEPGRGENSRRALNWQTNYRVQISAPQVLANYVKSANILHLP